MVTKQLKSGYVWEFEPDTKTLYVGGSDFYGHDAKIPIDKTRIFSLMRFLVRVSQKMSSQRRKK